MLEWNGAIIEGDIQIKDENKDEKLVLQRLEINKYPLVVVSSPYNVLSIVIDELKPYFGLHKTGTHIIKMKGKTKRVIYRTMDTQDESFDNNMLSMSDRKDFIPLVQQLLVYRDIFGVSPNTINDMRIRKEKSIAYVVSFGDKFSINVKSNTNNVGGKPMSQTLINKWFVDQNVSPEEIFRKLLISAYGRADIEIANNLRTAIEQIIKKWCPEYQWLSTYVYSNILRRLQI